MSEIIVIVHNIRSTHNVGSIFRTCEGFGVSKILLSGYSPYPKTENDPRLPHVADKATRQIHKTALGAEGMVPFEYSADVDYEALRHAGYRIVGLEQATGSIQLTNYNPPKKLALVLGEEVHGISPLLLEQCDDIVEIPMVGKKESFNVSVATGIALYHLAALP